jgi:hypothetical protein
MGIDDLNPLEREIAEKVMHNICLKIARDVAGECADKIAELTVAVVMGRMTEEDAELEINAFAGALQLGDKTSGK